MFELVLFLHGCDLLFELCFSRARKLKPNADLNFLNLISSFEFVKWLMSV